MTVVSKYVGHASVTMTLNVHSRVVQGAQKELADTFEGVSTQGLSEVREAPHVFRKLRRGGHDDSPTTTLARVVSQISRKLRD